MKEKTLENFMKEFFDFKSLVKVGFFSKEMKGDYKAQAERVCKYFGYNTVYEHGKDEVRCHITYSEGHAPPIEVNSSGKLQEPPFVTVIPSIYDNPTD